MLKKKLVIATNNPDKFKEIRAILKDLCVEFIDLQGAHLPEETGKTLEQNAIMKARAAYELTNEAALADDTGLEVEALENAPGVYSARFAGPNATYTENRKKLLALLGTRPVEQRRAKFRCVVAVVKDKNVKTYEGKVNGYITNEEVGNRGFGYDSVFFVPGLGKTFAQLKPEQKNKVSHRAIALLKAKKYLLDKITG